MDKGSPCPDRCNCSIDLNPRYMTKKNIVPGTQYQFDLIDLAVIGKNETGITLAYKQGLKVQIDIDDPTDKERQYKEICDLHSKD